MNATAPRAVAFIVSSCLSRARLSGGSNQISGRDREIMSNRRTVHRLLASGSVIDTSPLPGTTRTSRIHRVTPCLWFDSEAEDAANHSLGNFPNSRIRRITRYGKEGFEAHGRPEGSVMTVEFDWTASLSST
jgi:hypothetical protein